jgi:hypothetical protein
MGEETTDDNLWYTAEACPCVGDCSDQSWTRCAAMGKSEDEVRAKVKQHLMVSGHHKKSAVDAESFAWATVINSQSWTDEHVHEFERLKKRHKPAQVSVIGAGSAWPRTGDWKKAPAHSKQEIMEMMMEALTKHAGPRQPRNGPRGNGGASSSSRPDGALQLAVRHEDIRRENPERRVSIRSGQIKAAMDSLNRAETACSAAGRCLKDAARAFEDEENVIKDAKQSLKRALDEM